MNSSRSPIKSPHWLSPLFAFFAVAAGLRSQEIVVEQPLGTELPSTQIIAWGYGPTTIPTGLSGVQAVRAGYRQSGALKADGTVVGWGSSSLGLSGIRSFDLASSYGVALKLDGTVQEWGNSMGHIAPAGLSGVQTVDASSNKTMAIIQDGTLVTWGSTFYGESPPPTGLTRVKAVAAGDYHSVVLKENGTVVAWGLPNYGNTEVPEALSGVRAIAAGDEHTLALRQDGTVVAWGNNRQGQTSVPADLSGVRAIFADGASSAAIRQDGSLVLWGRNRNSIPVATAPSLLSGVREVSQSDHALVLKGSTLDFGSRALGTTSPSKPFSVRNTSSSVSLQISGVTVWGANAQDFIVNYPAGASTVVPNGSDTPFSITFFPQGTATGQRRAWLKIANSDVDEGSYAIELTGSVPANTDITVFTGDSTALVNERTNTTPPVAFPAAVVGQTTEGQVFTVKNSGLADLRDLSWTLEGTGARDFVIDQFGPGFLASSETSSFTVSFRPRSGGSRQAKLRIYSNDPNESPFTVNLTGTATVAEIALVHNGLVLESTQVIGWGESDGGQAVSPAGLSGVVAIAAGGDETAAVKADGTVAVWGASGSGEAAVPAGLTGVKTIALGDGHVAALKTDGSVAAWGNNSYGQINVPQDLTDGHTLACGSKQVVVLKQDGSVVGWGNFFSPHILEPGGVMSIAAGGDEARGIRTDGAVLVWENFITKGVEDVAGVRSIALGGPDGNVYRLYLKMDGTVLGRGTIVPEGLSGVRAVSAGRGHSMALKQDGTVVAWGNNFDGQSTVPTGLTGVHSIAAGNDHSLALKASTVAFGNQALGTTGPPKTFTVQSTGSAALQIASVSVVGENAADFSVDSTQMASSVAANIGSTSFSVSFAPQGTAPGSREAWLWVASNDPDEAGYVIALSGKVPTDAEIAVFAGASTSPADERQTNATLAFPHTKLRTPSPGSVFTIKNIGISSPLSDLRWEIVGAAASDFRVSSYGSPDLAPSETVSLTVTFQPYAAGLHQAELRIYSTDPDESPFTIQLTGLDTSSEIAVREPGGPALESGQVVAWGSNSDGQSTVPAELSGVRAVAAERYHTVALLVDGTVRAWGGGSTPPYVPSDLVSITAIAAGESNAFALRENGTLTSWYLDNQFRSPFVPSNLGIVRAVSQGSSHTMVLNSDGFPTCWGDNSHAQSSVPAGLAGVWAISAGTYHSVALKQEGTVVAWGSNFSGQSTVPTGLSAVRAIAAGALHTLALKSDGTVAAWGSNEDGRATAPPGLANVKFIAAGSRNSVAVRQDGTVVAWGGNVDGLSTVPVGLSGVHSVAAGDNHVVALKASTVDFGSQAIGGSGATKLFEIANTGTAELLVSSVSLSGPDAADFQVNTTAMATTVPANSGQTAFTVTFAPTGTATGHRRAWMRVASDDVDESNYAIALQGTVPADATLAVFAGASTAPADELPTSGAAFTFPDTLLQHGSTTRVFTLKNLGPAALGGLSWTITGASAGEFTLGTFGLAGLGASQTAEISVTFRPVASGSHSAELRFYNQYSASSLFNIQLTGRDVSPEISLEKPVGTTLALPQLRAWGDNNYRQTDIPDGLSSVIRIAAGEDHTLALKQDGTVVVWGYSWSGAYAVTVPSGLSGVQDIDAGDGHNLALKQDGTIVAWGSNIYGQTNVPAGLTAVRAISAGGRHSVALQQDGTVAAWGNNASGETNIPAGLAGVKAIAAGGAHTLALKVDGTVVAWGRNNYGQTTIPTGLAGVQAIAAGYYFSLALKQDGTVVAWGDNGYGQRTVPAGLAGVRAVFAGAYHSIALKGDGTLVAWGHNEYGQSTIPAGLAGVQTCAAGDDHTVVLTSEGGHEGTHVVGTSIPPTVFTISNTGTAPLNISAVRVFGEDAADFTLNMAGMLNSVPPAGTTTFSVTYDPVGLALRYPQAWLLVSSDDLDEESYLVALSGAMVTDAEISLFKGTTTEVSEERQSNDPAFAFPDFVLGGSGTTQAFTVLNKGALLALTGLRWDVIGLNAANFTVDRTTNADLLPNGTASFTVTFRTTSTGLKSAQIRVFSNDPDEAPFLLNLEGQGVTPEIGVEYPPGSDQLNARVVPWGSQTSVPQFVNLVGAQAISLGGSHSVALRQEGTVVGWGTNTSGQTAIPSGLADVKAISAGGVHTLALKQDGTVAAWGGNSSGQTNIPAGLVGVKAISAGANHSVALREDGTVVAWGSGVSANPVPPGLSGVHAVAAGGSHTMALKQDGTVVCWGSNTVGQCNQPGLTGVVAIGAGNSHSTALKNDGTVVVWGDNSVNQRAVPAGLSGIQAISARYNHTLALKEDGTVIAWGFNTSGQSTIPSGLVPVWAIEAGASHSAAVRAAEIPCGSVEMNVSSPPRPVAIRNTGTHPLQITAVRVIGPHAADFHVNTTEMTTPVAVGGSTGFAVTFTPTARGHRQAWVEIVSDDLDEGSFRMVLSGSAPESIAPFKVFTGNTTDAAAERQQNDLPIAFPKRLVGAGNSVSQTFTVQSLAEVGTALSLVWDIVGPAAEDFQLDRYAALGLTTNLTAILTVSFSPKSTGAKTAQLRIFRPGLNAIPFAINLVGEGISPEISVEHPRGTELSSTRMLAWGLPPSGFPATYSGLQAISVGGTHAAAVRLEGTAFAWGSNSYGQTTVPFGLSGVASLVAGARHTAALKQDGTVVAWGDNTYAQRNVPTALSGKQVVAVAAGTFHSVALWSDGTVLGWGRNTDGQTNIPAGLSDVIAVAAGERHTVALKQDGAVVAWGSDSQGQRSIPAGLAGVRAIAAGQFHTLALKQDGTVLGWGRSVEGQTAVMAPSNNQEAPHTIAAGGNYNLALVGSSVHLGSAVATRPGPSTTVTVRNTGSSPLNLSTIRILGTHASEFSLDIGNPAPLVLEPSGHELGISLTFNPQAAGPRHAYLVIASDDLNEQDVRIHLTGTGLPHLPPALAGAIPAQTVRIGTSMILDLASFFYDAEGTPLTFKMLTNSSPAAVGAALLGPNLSLTGLVLGTSNLTVQVTDAGGFVSTATFAVTAVVEFPPPDPLLTKAISLPARLPDGSLLLPLSLVPGRSYQLEHSSDLIIWQTASDIKPAGAQQHQWIDRGLLGPVCKRFYRLRELGTLP